MKVKNYFRRKNAMSEKKDCGCGCQQEKEKKENNCGCKHSKKTNKKD